MGSSKLGRGGAPNAGRTATKVSTIAVTGMKIARHRAITSCLVNLDGQKYSLLANNLFIVPKTTPWTCNQNLVTVAQACEGLFQALF